MKVYFTETRNENGDFYRRGDWGIEKANDWDNGRSNWTTAVPPEDCMTETDPLPCDWDTDTQAWVVDDVEQQTRTIKAQLVELDTTVTRQSEDIISALTAAGVDITGELYAGISGAISTKESLRTELAKLE